MIPFIAEQLRMTFATLSCFYFCSLKGGTKSGRPSHIKIQPFVGKGSTFSLSYLRTPSIYPVPRNPIRPPFYRIALDRLSWSCRGYFSVIVAPIMGFDYIQSVNLKIVASRATTSNDCVLLNESSSEYLYFRQVKTSCALSTRHDRQQSDCLVTKDKRAHD